MKVHMANKKAGDKPVILSAFTFHQCGEMTPKEADKSNVNYNSQNNEMENNVPLTA